MKKPVIHLYQIINELDEILGIPHISVSVAFISNSHIYFQILYKKNILVTKDTVWENECEVNKEYDMYAMCKLWIHDKNMGQFGTLPQYENTLWRDALYVNPYTMPDKNLAEQFQNAVMKWCEYRAKYIVGRYDNISIEGKLKEQAKKCLSKNANRMKEEAEDIIGKRTGHWLMFGSQREQLHDLQRQLKDFIPPTTWLLFMPTKPAETQVL